MPTIGAAWLVEHADNMLVRPNKSNGGKVWYEMYHGFLLSKNSIVTLKYPKNMLDITLIISKHIQR